MKKIPIILGTLGLSLGLLGTSVIGASSDSTKGLVKEKSVAGTEQTKGNGVQLRWWSNNAIMDPVGKTTFLSSSSSSSSSMCYASAGGMVGGHAPEMDIKEFGR
ncbi:MULTISPECIES: hypothetical protein [Bacillus]|uniref:Uncharacterized protein n=1 Tax=Bacillus wiedmannii TaxID=1890302 RepID=A0A0G8C7U4_9BACI|nr:MULTISPECIES: hypothetical protein [Bacillus]MCU4759488.1 hypothetical protein [Bacillus cereus]HDR7436882.1 hypothetical protein [Bacillus anthracis]KKZ95913.1 hypothetical protein B4147_5876 [Bacillus wiedmannii]MBJ8099767.1 hypothetical protein [Bacillus cereus group sp. N11]MBY7130193.1 hypothetical protein [Bacillus sp. 8YEL33]